MLGGLGRDGKGGGYVYSTLAEVFTVVTNFSADLPLCRLVSDHRKDHNLSEMWTDGLWWPKNLLPGQNLQLGHSWLCLQ